MAKSLGMAPESPGDPPLEAEGEEIVHRPPGDREARLGVETGRDRGVLCHLAHAALVSPALIAMCPQDTRRVVGHRAEGEAAGWVAHSETSFDASAQGTGKALREGAIGAGR